ncbi:MAG: SDR family NAD-dependent epimerase/dehydratase, partial [Nocardioidaceae bacterium]|nr:SDR family NAD-dependent epimerase/dehydratase [Nocardioidaceae bacterium]
HEISMVDLARWIIELTGSSSAIEFIPRPVDDPEVRRPDASLARSVLDWQPVVPIEVGLKHTIDWFREHPELVDVEPA